VVVDEVTGADFTPTVVVVDGEPDVASFVTYRGLDFVLGDDVLTKPYAMARPAGLSAPWPTLRLADLNEGAWSHR
jgi:hypothetical protein